jgi:hypothetical protein
MPTIPQLPPATSSGAQDELPISQSGITRAVTVAELLDGTQPAIEIPSASLLGRVSLGPGGPEAVQVGVGLALSTGTVIANGTDHVGFSEVPAFSIADEVIVNASGAPSRMPMPLLRSLFAAGNNVAIDANGSISASTDPSVTAEFSTLTQGLATTESNVASLTAKIPTGGYVGLNAQGEITAPTAGPVTLGTVMVATGTPSRTVGARALDTLNVLDFGASTSGGDSTAAFNAAYAALPASGGEIFMPAGDYQLASSLTWSGKPVVVRGAGKGVTRLHIQHTGIGFDFSQTNPFNKVVLREFSAYAESQSGQTAAVARITFSAQVSFGYVSAFITDIECFGYPNGNNGTPPFPQTFLRGFVLNNCWSVQVNNVSWFGPPATAGSTNSAVVEVNGAIDTRINGVQAYYGHAVVLQTGYCEGIYFTNPLVVGVDYLFTQTDITTWPGYTPTRLMLLGLWCANGEVNTNLGTVLASAVGGGYFLGVDITRDGGPSTAQSFFHLTDVSNLFVVGCNFVGGPSGANRQDIAFNFNSTFNSSNCTVGGCQFQDMATAILINNGNGTVALTTFGLNIGNVPMATAVIDNSASNVGNYIAFQAPSTAAAPAGIACTKDHVFAADDGTTTFRINNIGEAANYIRHQAASASNPPTIAFDGTDGTINGVIQTKGGDLFVNASGGAGNSGNIVSFLNIAGAANWLTLQNATSGNLSLISTNAGGLGLQPNGALWLSPASGLFANGLPTVKPVSGSKQVWNNNGVISIA